MKDETRSFYEVAVRRAIETIFDQLDDALDLAALARLAALSPLHFHRIFRGMTGETPLELHRRLRMERAAYQLVHGESPITRIAFDAGYETHESFTRAFGSHYGVSPSLFRQRASEALSACARPPQIELAAKSGLHFIGARSSEFPGPSFSFTPFSKGDFVMKVELKELPERRVAAVRHVGAYNRISEAFGRLGQIAGPAGLFGANTEMLALYHDAPDSTPVDQLRSDAALTVAKDAKLPSGLSEITIPSGRYATTTFVGPYTGLGDVWAQLMGNWLPQSGHRVGPGPTFEIYRNNPQDTPADKLVTEVYLSIV